MIPIDNATDYSTVTEAPGLMATHEQVARLYQRYHFAARFAQDKDVLEVACGSGIGLGYLAKMARKVVGVDIDEKNLRAARQYSEAAVGKQGLAGREKIDVKLMDAHNLSLPPGSFDLVLLFEGIYYLREPQKFISEAQRVLRERGKLIICSVNKDWEDFHPSPYTHKYFSVSELHELLEFRFNAVEMLGGFPVANKGFKNRAVSTIKRAAVDLNLIPGSLKLRAYLKRIFMGKLVPLPEEVHDGMASYKPPERIPPDQPCNNFKIIYAIAEK
jgi:ubiquinone/menaquinone biosynthesis C-methylase UbiE